MLSLALMDVSQARASEFSSSARTHDGCSTLEASASQAADLDLQLELAECYAQAGRTASAWERYREAARAAREANVPALETEARAHAKALESELSYVTVSTWRGQEVDVTRDGLPVARDLLGTAIPVDPGWHLISASAPGKRGWSKRIELGNHGDHVNVAVPVLPDDANLVPALNANAARLPPSAPPTKSPASDSVQRTLALVAGAIGIAGIATGTLFGVKAASDWSEAKDQCPAYPYCGEDGARLAQQAQTSATISTVGFVTGIAGLTGGALLWFTSPTREKNPEAKRKMGVAVGVGAVHVTGTL